jgi:hypothetical protein
MRVPGTTAHRLGRTCAVGNREAIATKGKDRLSQKTIPLKGSPTSHARALTAANRGGWRRASRRERVRIGPLPARSRSLGQSEQTNELLRRRLQARRLGLTMAQELPDLADLALHAGDGHLSDAGSARNESAGVHIGEIIATGLRGRAKDGVCTLRTGTDSPVNGDSSACRSSACRSTASAGTRSPSESTTKSPRTTSRPGIRFARAVADRERARTRRSRKASSTRRSVRVSCTTVTTREAWRTRAESALPANRPMRDIRASIGSRSTSRIRRKGVRLPARGSSI